MLFENQVALDSASLICIRSINEDDEMIVTELTELLRLDCVQYALLSAILLACSGAVQARTNAFVCCCTASMVGGWLGRWVGVSCGVWVVFRR